MNPAVVLPAGGGFGASTIPLTGCAVEGVGSEFNGTEFVTGTVEAVGETLLGLPKTLLSGCGMLGGVEGAGGAPGATAGTAVAGPMVWACVTPPGSTRSGSVSVAS